jgi:hypothetical protein
LDTILPPYNTIGDAVGSSTSTFNGTGDFRDIVPQTYGIYTLQNKCARRQSERFNTAR